MAILFQQFLIPIGAGLAVFMAGMKIMEHALYAWTGGWMKSMLTRLTGTPFLGLLVGTGTTAVLQSSSAITVVTIGMVNAGVLSFPRTLGIILGTNIGTCLTTELIGLNLTAASFPGLAASIAVWLASNLPLPAFKRAGAVIAAIRGLSLAAAGFCGIMLGIRIMQGIVPFLQDKGLLAWFLEHAQLSPLWGIVAGAVLTAVIHSSSASIAMTMSLAGLGAIPVPLGIAIVLGCNVGTCVTALIAGIGGGRYGRYVAYSHLILNVAGAILFYPFIGLLHAISAWITADPAGQIAHAQTLFNIICSLLALPVCYLPAIRRLGGNEPATVSDQAGQSGTESTPSVKSATGHGKLPPVHSTPFRQSGAASDRTGQPGGMAMPTGKTAVSAGQCGHSGNGSAKTGSAFKNVGAISGVTGSASKKAGNAPGKSESDSGPAASGTVPPGVKPVRFGHSGAASRRFGPASEIPATDSRPSGSSENLPDDPGNSRSRSEKIG